MSFTLGNLSMANSEGCYTCMEGTSGHEQRKYAYGGIPVDARGNERVDDSSGCSSA
jgi:hypothetical protein